MALHQILFYLLVLFLPIQLGRHFWPSWTYIFGLRIDYLSPTVYLTDLLIIAVLISWGFSGSRSKEERFFKNKKRLIPLGFVFGFLIINCYLAQNQGAAFYKFVKIIELIFLGFYLSKNRFSFSLISSISSLLAIGIFFSGFVALGQFLKASSLGGLFWWLGERTFNISTPGIARGVFRERIFLRPYSIFSHPNSLAGYLLVSSILTLPALFQKNKFLVFISLAFMTLIFVLTDSWSAWMVGGLIIFFGFLVFFLKNRNWESGLVKGFFPMGFFLSFFLFTTFYHRFSLKKDSLDKRVILNRVAIKLISRRPIMGVGLNNFIPAMSRQDPIIGQSYWLQPVHNLYLLILAETGVIGLGLFLVFIAKSYQRLFSGSCRKDRLAKPGRPSFRFCLGGCLTAILLLGLFDHYWLTLQQNQILMTLVLGLIWQEP